MATAWALSHGLNMVEMMSSQMAATGHEIETLAVMHDDYANTVLKQIWLCKLAMDSLGKANSAF